MHSQQRIADSLPIYHPEELLRRRHADLLLEDGEEVQLVAQNERAHEYLARVHVRTVGDLQALGLVPRGLSEDAIKKVVLEDDKAAYQTAREIVAGGGVAHHCSCGGDAAALSRQSYRDALAGTYADVRKAANPALAALLSDHMKSEFRWDSIYVQSVKGWYGRVAQAALEGPVLVALFQDIRVGRNSRLILDAGSVDLLVRGIYIHRTGTMVHRGGYLQIWAATISRYVEWATVVVHVDTPWLLSH